MSKKNEFGLSSDDYAHLYNVWSNMNKRCYNKKTDRYYAYGARGIRVCEGWKSNFKTFAEWAVLNGWKRGLSIERVDVDSDYSPQNCCFIPMAEQPRNKTNNVRLTFDGVEHCLMEWCEIYDVPFKTAWMRLRRGHTDPEFLFYPGDLRSLRWSRGGVSTCLSCLT